MLIATLFTIAKNLAYNNANIPGNGILFSTKKKCAIIKP